MKKGLTELVFILDRSGSMEHLTEDTIGGFNSMIAMQKEEDGECLVSTVLFASDCEVIHDRLPLAEVPKMTRREYCAAGCTALYDALGGAIRHIATIHRYAREEDRPERTLFIITTDGMENASRKYRGREVRRMVEEAYSKAKELLLSHRDQLDQLAAQLYDKEVLFREDLERIYGPRPWETPEIPENPENPEIPELPENTDNNETPSEQ